MPKEETSKLFKRINEEGKITFELVDNSEDDIYEMKMIERAEKELTERFMETIDVKNARECLEEVLIIISRAKQAFLLCEIKEHELAKQLKNAYFRVLKGCMQEIGKEKGSSNKQAIAISVHAFHIMEKLMRDLEYDVNEDVNH